MNSENAPLPPTPTQPASLNASANSTLTLLASAEEPLLDLLPEHLRKPMDDMTPDELRAFVEEMRLLRTARHTFNARVSRTESASPAATAKKTVANLDLY